MTCIRGTNRTDTADLDDRCHESLRTFSWCNESGHSASGFISGLGLVVGPCAGNTRSVALIRAFHVGTWPHHGQMQSRGVSTSILGFLSPKVLGPLGFSSFLRVILKTLTATPNLPIFSPAPGFFSLPLLQSPAIHFPNTQSIPFTTRSTTFRQHHTLQTGSSTHTYRSQPRS